MIAAGLTPSAHKLPPGDEFLAFVGDEASLGVLQEFARDQGWPLSATRTGGFDAAKVALEESGAPRVLILDIDGAEDPVESLRYIDARCGGVCTVIAIGSANDIGLYRRLRDAGAFDYLIKPLDPAQIGHAVLSAVVQNGSKAEAGHSGTGHVAFLVGTRGGCGASTAAMNVAWILAHEHKRKTVLLDLDLHFGTAALSLDLEPGRGLREALETPSRLDSLLIASSLVSESEKLCVLAAEEAVEETIAFQPRALLALIEELRSSFDAVVVDFPRCLLQTHRRAFSLAQAVAVVSEVSLVGIRDHVRASSAIGSIGQPRLLNVAGRVGKGRPVQTDRATFERGIEAKLDLLLPEDPKAVSAAANQGRALPAVATGSPLTKALRRLAGDLSPAVADGNARSGLFRRFGLQGAGG